MNYELDFKIVALFSSLNALTILLSEPYSLDLQLRKILNIP